MRDNNPNNVEELVKLVQLKHSLTEEESIRHILDLQSQGRLVLKEKTSTLPSTLNSYLASTQVYWLVLALAATTTEKE